MRENTGKHGFFIGRVVTEWLPDGRNMRLMEDFIYVDPDGRKWHAPAGSIINGASIPQILWTTAGSPYTGHYRLASVVHDVACVVRRATWQEVHEMFYHAMLASGVEQLEAEIKAEAVRKFGPRWDKNGQDLFWPDQESAENLLQDMRRQIFEARVDSRRP